MKPDFDIERQLLSELDKVRLPRIDRLEARYRRASRPRSRGLTPMLAGLVVVGLLVVALTASTSTGSADATTLRMRFASMVTDAGTWRPFGRVPEVSPTPDRATPGPNGGPAEPKPAVPPVTAVVSKSPKGGNPPGRDGEGWAENERPLPSPSKDTERVKPSPSPSPSIYPSPSPEPSHSPD